MSVMKEMKTFIASELSIINHAKRRRKTRYEKLAEESSQNKPLTEFTIKTPIPKIVLKESKPEKPMKIELKETKPEPD